MEIGMLVADSGAFIKAVPLERWSSCVVTVKEVVSEIKDVNTRRRLQVFPYELHFKEPTSTALRHVTDFAKKTGDFGSLSSVDMKLMALTYQLSCEQEPEKVADLKKKPCREEPGTERVNMPGVVGFYKVDKKKSGLNGTGDEISTGQVDVNDRNSSSDDDVDDDIDEDVDDDVDEDVDDDEEGWINPDNMEQACIEMGGVVEEKPRGVAVGCVTTDFAMQNVLLQMGLTVISVDGLRVKQLRTYAKKCKACFKTTTNTALDFCPHCGNRTLAKVSITVGEDGVMHYSFLSKKQFSHRGLRYPLPLPKGGRHANNPILAPDQRVTYKQKRSRNGNVHPLHPDYIIQNSPFAMKDVTSRGAQISFQGGGGGGRGRKLRNPNAVRPKSKKK